MEGTLTASLQQSICASRQQAYEAFFQHRANNTGHIRRTHHETPLICISFPISIGNNDNNLHHTGPFSITLFATWVIILMLYMSLIVGGWLYTGVHGLMDVTDPTSDSGSSDQVFFFITPHRLLIPASAKDPSAFFLLI